MPIKVVQKRSLAFTSLQTRPQRFHLKKKSTSKFAVPSIPVRNKKVDHLKVEFSCDVSCGKVKKKTFVKASKKDLKELALNQVKTQEKAILKLVGAAYFYAEVLKEAEVKPKVCPLCNTLTSETFSKKLKKEILFLIRYAESSTASQKKYKFLKVLKPHEQVKVSSTSCQFSHLASSEIACNALRVCIEKDGDLEKVLQDFFKFDEMKQGKRDALKVFKRKLLGKAARCGICGNSVETTEIPRILGNVDKSLSHLNRSEGYL